MKLFVFDFDNTIVDGHTHNEIIKGKREGRLEANIKQDLVNVLPLIGSNDKWKKIFETLNREGHAVCIASFNSFGNIIPEFLAKTGLAKQEIEKIKIIAWLPKNTKTANKNQHIEDAIVLTNFSGNPSDIILIDDSVKNIKAAQKENYTTIIANEKGAHLDRLLNEYIYVDYTCAPLNEPYSLNTQPYPLNAQPYLKPEKELLVREDEAIFAELRQNVDGSMTIVYGDESIPHSENQAPPVDRSLKPDRFKQTSNFRARFFPTHANCFQQEEEIETNKSQRINRFFGW